MHFLEPFCFQASSSAECLKRDLVAEEESTETA
jgi:hypothetical protein